MLMRLMNGLLVVAFVIAFTACTPASDDADGAQDTPSGDLAIDPLEDTPAENSIALDDESTEATAAPTLAPTATINPGFPAIELLAAPGLGCSFDPAADEPLLFNALYYSMSSAYEVRERIFDEQGEMLFEAFQPGTEKTGPDRYALTPDAYEVPDGSALTLELVVSPAGIENAPFTGRSTLIYNCATGETIENTFERAGR